MRPVARFLFVALLLTTTPATQAQSAFSAAALQALSPEDRQKALQLMGGGAGLNQSDAPTDASADGPQTGLRAGGFASAQRPVATAPVVAAKLDLFPDLPVFGYELFGQSSMAASAGDLPAPAQYVLAPGDTVRVQLFGNDNQTLNLFVTRDGAINFPKLGPIQVAGLTLDDARQVIERRVGKEMIGVQTNITLGPLRGQQIFVLGDASRPGAYTVTGLATISQALFASGGIALTGSLRDVQLKRAGRVVGKLDLYELMLKGNSAGDVRIQSGDVIYIPPVGTRVGLSGAVRRPAVYELKLPTSLGAAIQLAGGLSPEAVNGQAVLERLDRLGQRQLLEVDIRSERALALELRDGDFLRVTSASAQAENGVSVQGFVRYPGNYPLLAGMSLQALLQKAQLRPSAAGREAYALMVLLERSNPESGLREWRALSRGSDEVLKPEDRVLVFERADIEFLGSPLVSAALKGDLLTDKCEALAEVAKISDSARALSMRMALRAQEGVTESRAKADLKLADAGLKEDQEAAAGPPAKRTKASAIPAAASVRMPTAGMAQDQAREPATNVCPAVFDDAPTALVALLESGVGVLGEVRRPGFYPVPPSVTVGNLVLTAGGFTTEADADRVDYFSRVLAADDRNGFLTRPYSELAGRVAIPGEIFQIKPALANQEVGAVDIRGEVRFPGRYVVTRGEHLSSIIARAGGLTDNAYPYGAVFTRESARKAEAAANRRSAQDLREALATASTKGVLASGGQNQSAATFVAELVQQLEATSPVGRVVIDADPASLAARPERDLLLEPGDALVIPKRPGSVTVSGQVLNPGSLIYSANTKAESYLDLAGGLTKGADAKRVFLVLPDGSARPLDNGWFTGWVGYREAAVPPGSTIVVPRDAAPMAGLLLTERIASIVGNLAISAAALSTITR